MESLDPLNEFCQQTLKKGIVGSLIGKTLSERNALFEREWEKFSQELEKGRLQAAETGKPVVIDGSGISLVNGGDQWVIAPDGQMERQLSTYPQFKKIFSLLDQTEELDSTQPVPKSEILQAAFNALWGPSATNWQPVMVIEISKPFKEAFCRHYTLPVALNLPLILLLRREHYDSLLGDVMESFGLGVTAKEESIDVGIYEQILKMSFCSQGLGYQCGALDDQKMTGAVDLVQKDLAYKLEQLSARKKNTEIKKIEVTLECLKKGKYFPDVLFQVGYPKGKPRQVVFPSFEQLTLERTTQRVASPTEELPAGVIEDLLKECLNALPAQERQTLCAPHFSWHDEVVKAIGEVMFEALYGKGADLKTKQGGEGGFLSEMNHRNYLLNLKRNHADFLPFFTEQQLREMPEGDVKHLALETSLQAKHLGAYLLERVTLDGKYREQNGELLAESGRPMSVALLVKLLKGIASTFGNFFLKFKNTHPVTLFLLCQESDSMQTQNARFKVVGKLAALLSYKVRSLGCVSIIKTGPIDLAKEHIRQVLIRHCQQGSVDQTVLEGLKSNQWSPAMVFQIGLPLAGSDRIDLGTPDEHDGLEERKKDRRPTRYGLDARYIPDCS